MNWRGASSSRRKARCVSHWPRSIPCSTAWNSAGGFAEAGKPAATGAAAAAIASRQRGGRSFPRSAKSGRSFTARCKGLPRCRMRDWEAVVEQHLSGLALEPAERSEVITELAQHLAETCEQCRKQGMTEEEAARRALSQVE